MQTVLKQDRVLLSEEKKYFTEVRRLEQNLFISKFISIFSKEIAKIRLEKLTFPSWPAKKSNYEDIIDREKNLEDDIDKNATQTEYSALRGTYRNTNLPRNSNEVYSRVKTSSKIFGRFTSSSAWTTKILTALEHHPQSHEEKNKFGNRKRTRDFVSIPQAVADQYSNPVLIDSGESLNREFVPFKKIPFYRIYLLS